MSCWDTPGGSRRGKRSSARKVITKYLERFEVSRLTHKFDRPERARQEREGLSGCLAPIRCLLLDF